MAMDTEKKFKVTILGSGSSPGVPVIGCPCRVCKSQNPRNQRTRSSLLLEFVSRGRHYRIVFDTSPDFRAQMLRAKVTYLDAVIYTHTHSDHLHGFDDLRAFYFRSLQPVPCYIHATHAQELRSRFSYAFRRDAYHGTKPQVVLYEFGESAFTIGGQRFSPALAHHGDMQTAVFRVGAFAYATDFKALSEQVRRAWRGKIHTMVASGHKWGEHPTHSTIEETLDLFRDLKVKRGIVTHLGHEVDFVKDQRKMPRGMALAYDGMRLVVPHSV